MDTTISERSKGTVAERVAATPATFALIILFWIFFLIQIAVLRCCGPDLTKSIFIVQYNHIGYIWTWVTAILSHVSVPHLVFNTFIALWLGRWSEKIVGTHRYLGMFFIGGAITAVGGTLVGGTVSGHLLVNFEILAVPQSSSTKVFSAAGSSMGWFSILGMMLAKNFRGQAHIMSFQLRRWVVFVITFILSIAGTLTNIWVFGPKIGHPYHLVGLVIGGLYGLALAHQTRQAEGGAFRIK